MTHLGVLVDPVHSPDHLIEIVRFLDEGGFSSFWYPDEKYFRDCYVGLTLAALNTRNLKLGPCVTDPFSRHPILTAVSIATLAELAPGRVWLGLGAGGRGLSEIGITPNRPATAIREAIEIIRGLLAGESVDYQGAIISLKDRPLDFKPLSGIKMMIGTGHGRFIQQLAGEVADAVMLANYATPDTIRKSIKWVERGAAKSNRSLSDLYSIVRIDVAIHPNGDEARAAVAPKILSALRSSYPELNYLEDLPEFEISSELIKILKKKDYQSRTYYSNPANIAHLIPKILTRNLSASGTPREVIAQLSSIIELGLFNEIVIRLIPVAGQKFLDALSLFQRDVMSSLQIAKVNQ